MTREIKFRIWDPINGMGEPFTIAYLPYIAKMCTSYGETLSNCLWLQYTGLKDKNGVEIYEGDIIFQDSEGYRTVGIVNMSSDLRWCVGSHYIPCQPFYNKYREIKGNIYENPELLK